MSDKSLIPQEIIQSKIIVLRDKKVILDKDLALLYGVETKVLNQAVRRNKTRFPDDFMFQLTKEEAKAIRSQIVTLEKNQHFKYLPHAFTEHGILMLSSVLNSTRAIQVNIQIMRTFTKMRAMFLDYQALKEKIENMEATYDYQFKEVFEIIRQLLIPPEEPKPKIGF